MDAAYRGGRGVRLPGPDGANASATTATPSAAAGHRPAPAQYAPPPAHRHNVATRSGVGGHAEHSQTPGTPLRGWAPSGSNASCLACDRGDDRRGVTTISPPAPFDIATARDVHSDPRDVVSAPIDVADVHAMRGVRARRLGDRGGSPRRGGRRPPAEGSNARTPSPVVLTTRAAGPPDDGAGYRVVTIDGELPVLVAE